MIVRGKQYMAVISKAGRYSGCNQCDLLDTDGKNEKCSLFARAPCITVSLRREVHYLNVIMKEIKHVIPE